MTFLENRDLTNVPSIPDYYKGKTIFITGGSGFIGKVLIEKLLYSCGDLDRIYLLMRSKRGVKSEDRLAQIYSLPCFNRLRTEKPDVFASKVFIVTGDVMEPGLGLSEEDRTLIINRVNIIFHVAASVRFDDPLPYAAKLNLNGTKQIVDLAKCIVDLSALVHVSTSYSNTNRELIEEVMYPAHADWRDVLEVCDSVDEHTLRVLNPKYLGEIPNTYTFTKQLAEHVMYEQRGQLPIVIVRPSIVISSSEEPVPGWIENFNGPVGIFVACGKGIMRIVYAKSDVVSDFIPVDLCVKNICAAAWIRGTKTLETTDDVSIYNCCSGNLRSILVGDLTSMAKMVAADVPLDNILWHQGGSVTTSRIIYYLRVLVQHLLPAILIDLLLWIFNKKPMLVKVQRRIYVANLALRYYLTKQWTFANQNFVALRSVIKAVDKRDFYYNVEDIDAVKYFTNCCYGGRRYLLNEKDEDIPKAKRHSNRMRIIDFVCQVICYGFLLVWLWNTISQYLPAISEV